MANNPNFAGASSIIGQVSTASHPGRYHSDSSIRVLALWITFDVLVGSGTIVWSLLTSFGSSKPIQFFDLFEHGELLIVSVSITAGAIGSLIRSENTQSTKGIIFLCVAFLMLFFGVLGFASLGVGGKATNVVGFGLFSLAWYICSVIASLNCILNSGGKHANVAN
jgi:hypothetical protein